MKLKEQNPKQSLNKAYLKEKVSRDSIENFKANLSVLLMGIKEKEHEENAKNKLTKFLYDSFYNGKNEINTKGRIDLAIYEDSKPVVVIECKKPEEKYDIISKAAPNAKAMHELILYYLRERIEHKNIDIKYLIATNIYEWFIFDEIYFDKLIFRNKKLIKDYENWRGKDTKFFYDNIAKPFVAELQDEIPFTYFNLKDYEKVVGSKDKSDDSKLISLFKILSPAHLLKQSFANDSNSLNKEFYNELLHIIGLEEVKEGNKKLIQRKSVEKRDEASLLENTIAILEQEESLRKLDNPANFGDTQEAKLFSVSLELCITWINRILFLKLLEAQLLNYHRGDSSYKFLDAKHFHDYDELNKLFFSVLAKKQDERKGTIKEKYKLVPYLNSSLFEISSLEDVTIKISNLDNNPLLKTYSGTVLKDTKGKRRTEQLSTLQYLFEFLDAYDFTAEGTEEIQEDNKTLINASVLGLIFEKINGYKDGSFFTPGFITMYMCRESISKAVLQKFNEHYKWKCEDLIELKDKIEDRKKANEIINSLKICDPAVGSGHFLVSALNEIIAIKSELKILCYRDGSRIKDYKVKVENDELIIIDEDEDEIFEYKMGKGGKPVTELQELQETLFHEKEIIIENCLFGVDINPNSVKICRLRLWIELLKHSYYTKESDYTELETLPNIDINIKKGNSLVSRFPLDSDLSKALKSIKYNINDYKHFVNAYKHATNKEEKRGYEKLIDIIKSDFKTNISQSDPKVRKLSKLGEELYLLTSKNIFEEEEADYRNYQSEKTKKRKKLEEEINKLRAEIDAIKSSAVYKNAFEWRFEFPEVLDVKGDFIGFDVVIANPPYGVQFSSSEKSLYSNLYSATDDIYTLFIEKGINLTKASGRVSLIIPIFWLTGEKYYSTRKVILDQAHLDLGITLPYNIFPDAYVDTGIYMFSKIAKSDISFVYEFEPREKIDYSILNSINLMVLKKQEWSTADDLKIIFNPVSRSLTNKINKFNTTIEQITDSIRGILGNQEDYSAKPIKGYEPIFVGKINRFFIEEGKLQFIKYGDNLKEKPSSFDYFTGERILIRRIISRQFRIMATISDKRFVSKKDIYTFKPNQNKFSPKYLLAIINSKLISFIKTKGSTSAKKDDFTQLTLNDIRQLRIPEPKQKQSEKIENIVDQILFIKGGEESGKIYELEKQLDKIVYELYELTEEEIKIVERNYHV